MKREIDALALQLQFPSDTLRTLPLVYCALLDTSELVALPVPICEVRSEREVTGWRPGFADALNGEH